MNHFVVLLPGAWLSYYGYEPLSVGTDLPQTLSFTAAMPFGISGIKNVALDVAGMYRWGLAGGSGGGHEMQLCTACYCVGRFHIGPQRSWCCPT
jgi:hypothetical protein